METLERKAVFFLLLLGLGACATLDGRGLVPGRDDRSAVIAALGAPALVWRNPDGSEQLAYPRGPMGPQTYVARIGADGKLQALENVLEPRVFAQVKPGLSQDQVLRLIGPPQPQWTQYFKARDELVWEWRYCDPWNQFARFDVLFDGASRTVRSTLSRSESQMGECAGLDGGGCWCSH